MERIEIIKDKSKLEGTCYIELSLGKYQGKHWEQTSLFFDEEVFGYIEMVFEKHVVNYDHYNMNDADSEAWYKIISDLKKLIQLLQSANEFSEILGKVGFVFGSTRDDFQSSFKNSKYELCEMIKDLVNWAELNIKNYGHIAVLGI
jgi:hypothetical protein